MIEVIENRQRKARKPHKCDYCHGTIEPGEVYDCIKQKDGGDFYTFHCHLKCDYIAQELWQYADPDDWGMDADLFSETVQEFSATFVCPDCPKYIDEIEECTNDEVYCLDRVYEFLKENELYKVRRTPSVYGYVWKCRKREKKED